MQFFLTKRPTRSKPKVALDGMIRSMEGGLHIS